MKKVSADHKALRIKKGHIGSHTENCCVNKMNWFL